MRRTLRPLAALAMVGLLSAGCSNALAGPRSGSIGSNTAAIAPTQTGIASGTSSDATNRDQAVKFAACMRKNGVRAFPDPDASGTLTIDGLANGSSLDTNSAAFRQAISACRDLEPAGFAGARRSPEQQQAALKFAQCMRDNGVKDFPDPTPDGALVDTNRIPSAAENGVAAINAAMRKCRDFAASAGVKGP